MSMIADLMAKEFSIAVWILLLLGVGWFFLMWSVILHVAIFIMTPVRRFLAAKLLKRPLAKMNFRDGTCEFMVGKKEVPGSMNIRKIGVIDMIEGSQTLEKISGIPIYECFAENATSIPLTYSAIIEKLRDNGFDIVNFEQYRTLIELATDEQKRNEYRASIPVDKRDSFDAKIELLKKLDIKLEPFKSFKVHELATMFPFNMNPVFVEQYSTAQLVAQAKKMKFSKELLIFGAIGTFILVIAAFVAIKFLGTGDVAAAQVTVQITPELLRTMAANATTNATTILTV